MPEDDSSEGYRSPIQVYRALRRIRDEEVFALVRGAMKEGVKGLAAHGISVVEYFDQSKFFQSFMDELQAMIDAGKVREDAATSGADSGSWREFFKFIDGSPDELRFRAFCALFMDANAPDAAESTALLDLQLMQLIRNLSAGEMQLLYAFMQIKETVVNGPSVYSMVGKHLGYTSQALIQKNAAALVAASLVEGHWLDQSGSGGVRRKILTDLGELLLDRITRYNDFKTAIDRD